MKVSVGVMVGPFGRVIHLAPKVGVRPPRQYVEEDDVPPMAAVTLSVGDRTIALFGAYDADHGGNALDQVWPDQGGA